LLPDEAGIQVGLRDRLALVAAGFEDGLDEFLVTWSRSSAVKGRSTSLR
jgi:hypothetical protein